MAIEIAALRRQITRRTALGGAAAMGAVPALAQESPIGPPPHAKGPLVWMDMDQVELDASYESLLRTAKAGDHQAIRVHQRSGAWSNGQPCAKRTDRNRKTRHLSREACKCADLRFHPWRGLAWWRSKELCFSG